jgi:hypothetical protein
MIRQKDAFEVAIDHYAASDVKRFNIRCRRCRIDLNQLECIHVFSNDDRNDRWFCVTHQPFAFIRPPGSPLGTHR